MYVFGLGSCKYSLVPVMGLGSIALPLPCSGPCGSPPFPTSAWRSPWAVACGRRGLGTEPPGCHTAGSEESSPQLVHGCGSSGWRGRRCGAAPWTESWIGEPSRAARSFSLLSLCAGSVLGHKYYLFLISSNIGLESNSKLEEPTWHIIKVYKHHVQT